MLGLCFGVFLMVCCNHGANVSAKEGAIYITWHSRLNMKLYTAMIIGLVAGFVLGLIANS